MADPNYSFDFSMLQSAAMSFVGGPAGAAAGALPAGAAPAAAFGSGAAPAAAPVAAAPAAAGAAGVPAGLDANALIAASPFGPLLNLPGITAGSLLASLSEGNGFASLGALGTAAGNPFAGVAGANSPFPAGTANPFDNYVGAGNPFASGGNPFASANSTGA